MIGKIKALFLGLFQRAEPAPQPVPVRVDPPYLLTDRVHPRRRDLDSRPRGLFTNKYKYQID